MSQSPGQNIRKNSPRTYRRWTVEEDITLLKHVMRAGTGSWGALQLGGSLPLRDNKACCNRFILLKRKYLGITPDSSDANQEVAHGSMAIPADGQGRMAVQDDSQGRMAVQGDGRGNMADSPVEEPSIAMPDSSNESRQLTGGSSNIGGHVTRQRSSQEHAEVTARLMAAAILRLMQSTATATAASADEPAMGPASSWVRSLVSATSLDAHRPPRSFTSDLLRTSTLGTVLGATRQNLNRLQFTRTISLPLHPHPSVAQDAVRFPMPPRSPATGPLLTALSDGAAGISFSGGLADGRRRLEGLNQWNEATLGLVARPQGTELLDNMQAPDNVTHHVTHHVRNSGTIASLGSSVYGGAGLLPWMDLRPREAGAPGGGVHGPAGFASSLQSGPMARASQGLLQLHSVAHSAPCRPAQSLDATVRPDTKEMFLEQSGMEEINSGPRGPAPATSIVRSASLQWESSSEVSPSLQGITTSLSFGSQSSRYSSSKRPRDEQDWDELRRTPTEQGRQQATLDTELPQPSDMNAALLVTHYRPQVEALLQRQLTTDDLVASISNLLARARTSAALAPTATAIMTIGNRPLQRASAAPEELFSHADVMLSSPRHAAQLPTAFDPQKTSSGVERTEGAQLAEAGQLPHAQNLANQQAKATHAAETGHLPQAQNLPNQQAKATHMAEPGQLEAQPKSDGQLAQAQEPAAEMELEQGNHQQNTQAGTQKEQMSELLLELLNQPDCEEQHLQDSEVDALMRSLLNDSPSRHTTPATLPLTAAGNSSSQVLHVPIAMRGTHLSPNPPTPTPQGHEPHHGGQLAPSSSGVFQESSEGSIAERMPSSPVQEHSGLAGSPGIRAPTLQQAASLPQKLRSCVEEAVPCATTGLAASRSLGADPALPRMNVDVLQWQLGRLEVDAGSWRASAAEPIRLRHGGSSLSALLVDATWPETQAQLQLQEQGQGVTRTGEWQGYWDWELQQQIMQLQQQHQQPTPPQQQHPPEQQQQQSAQRQQQHQQQQPPQQDPGQQEQLHSAQQQEQEQQGLLLQQQQRLQEKQQQRDQQQLREPRRRLRQQGEGGIGSMLDPPGWKSQIGEGAADGEPPSRSQALGSPHERSAMSADPCLNESTESVVQAEDVWQTAAQLWTSCGHSWPPETEPHA